MPTSHIFEVTLADDDTELTSKRVSKLSRRYSHLNKKNPHDRPVAGHMGVPRLHSCEQGLYLLHRVQHAKTGCPPSLEFVQQGPLLCSRYHPAAIVARGCGTGRPPKQPPLSTCESPHRNTKEKVIESMKPQLRLPKDPVAAVPTVARAGTGVADLAGNDSNGEEEEEGSPHCPYPAHVSGGKTMGL
jgi:hypothetical protein